MTTTQISAYVSGATKEQLDKYTEAHGIKKGHLVEMALLHHLQALRELPADIIIPPRIVVDRETGVWLLDLMEQPPAPTEAMKELFGID